MSEEKERDLGTPVTERAMAEFGAPEVHSMKCALLSERFSPLSMLISNTHPLPFVRVVPLNDTLLMDRVTVV